MEENLAVNKGSLSRALILSAIVILVVAVWFWWCNVYEGQQSVFWGMINNNLATSSIGRHVVQQNQGQTLEQDIQLYFGGINGSHSFITLSQDNNGAKTTVKSETIGTPTADYSRYTSIKTAQRNSKNQVVNTSGLINIWAKTGQLAGAPNTGQYFNQAIFTIVPYGNFDAGTRQQLVKFIRDNKVYSLTTVKNTKVNGKAAYIYTVNVRAAAYIATMAEYVKALGLGDLGLDAEQYQNSPALQVQFTVAKTSRQLLAINYPASQQEETFYSQGLEGYLPVPSKTIPLSELQTRIQNTLQ